MMSLTFGLFTWVSGLGPLGPLVSFEVGIFSVINGVPLHTAFHYHLHMVLI